VFFNLWSLRARDFLIKGPFLFPLVEKVEDCYFGFSSSGLSYNIESINSYCYISH